MIDMDGMWQCETCKCLFPSEEYKHIHRNCQPPRATTHPWICKLCHFSTDKQIFFEEHVQTHSLRRPYPCTICGNKFTRTESLRRHLKIHTGEKPHACSHCGKRFGLSSHLKTHVMIHTGIKPHVCQTCGKGFRDTFCLKRHVMTHTGEKPHLCSLCNKGFSMASGLKTHMRTHTGEKPHSCDYCDKGFSNSSSLKRHLMTHTGEKPFVCGTCGKGFKSGSNLNTHMKTHGQLNSHSKGAPAGTVGNTENLKSQQEPQQQIICNQCGKVLDGLAELKKHMVSHTVELPSVFTHFGKSFPTNPYINPNMQQQYMGQDNRPVWPNSVMPYVKGKRPKSP